MLARLRENETVRLGAITAVLALLALLPLLGQFGFWDPHEIAVADKARALTRDGGYAALWKKELPLTPWLVASFTATFGRSELVARLPLALLGVAAALATYGLGARLRRPRAGLYGAVALLASPLFLFQARQLMSDMGAIAGGAIAMFGLAGLAWPAGRRRPLLDAVDAALVAAGLLLGLFSAGLFLGVAVPLSASALAALPFVRRDRRARAFAAAVGGASLVVLLAVFFQVFHWEPAQPGARAVFGQTLKAAREYLPWIGGTFRPTEAPVTATFDWIINKVAFGMFPWSAVAPIAVLRLALLKDRGRADWGGVLVVAWATVAYLVASLFLRGFGDLRYPGLAALALACGLFIDDVAAAKLEGDAARAPSAPSGMPIAALFIFIAGLILSLDIRNFPVELAAVHLLGATIEFPRAIRWLVYAAIVFGVAFSAAAAVGVHTPAGAERTRLLNVPRRKLVELGLRGAVAVSFVFALFVSWVYTPRLSEHFSYKNLFEAYFERRQGSEPLAVMGIPGSGPEYYARGRFERIDAVARLLEFLKQPERVFAMVPSDRLCTLHQNNTGKVKYHVVDTRNSRFFLLSNQLASGETDESPIAKAFHREPPARFDRQVQANWEDTVELLGVDMPESVEKGDRFKVTLWFKVKKRFAQSQQIFMHFDGAGVRFQGDHFPVACNTQFWQPGDIVSDTHTVTAAPDITHPRTTYTLNMGFFTGSFGSWKNMTVVQGNRDGNNRVPVGTIRVR
jgi:4-amino-4-deoxy-L-arabinose transferase-like glycosyltransferase